MRKYFAPLLALLFFLSLAVPLIVSLATPDAEISAQEKRTLKAFPQWSERESLKGYFGGLTEYANDHFGFREALIALHKKLLWAAGQSPSEYVIRGEDDWLFLKIRDPLLSQTRYSHKTTRNILKRRVAYIEKMQAEMASRGIAYRYVVASNKMSLYPQRLPPIYALTDIDASYSYFKSLINDAVAPVMVFTDEIVAAYRADDPDYELYFKNDTHWNDLGAYQVFNHVVSSLKTSHPNLELLHIERDFRPFRKYSGDLAQYVGLNDQLTAIEPFTDFLPCAQPSNVSKPQWGVDLSVCNMNDTTILMIGDSFLFNFYPYFSESAGKLYKMRQNMSRARLLKIIDEYQPDVVIEEIVERELAKPIPN